MSHARAIEFHLPGLEGDVFATSSWRLTGVMSGPRLVHGRCLYLGHQTVGSGVTHVHEHPHGTRLTAQYLRASSSAV